MIEEYGTKKVVTDFDKSKSIIIEQKNGELVARIYERDVFNKCISEYSHRKLDIKRVQKINDAVAKVREITRQLGTGGYVIHKDVLPLINSEL